MMGLGIYARLAAAAVVLALLAGLWWHGNRHGAAGVRQEWDAAVSAQRQAQLDAEQAARSAEQARIAAVQEIAANARRQAQNARRDADSARAVVASLRDAADAAATRFGPSDPASAGGGDANRLAAVVAECGGRLAEVASVADRAIIAGQACERAYSALSP